MIRGDRAGIVREGVSDVLMTALVFARPLKLGARAVRGLAAAEIGWDVAVAAWDGMQAMRLIQQGQPGPGGQKAAEALLRLFGVPFGIAERRTLIALMEESGYSVRIYNKTGRHIDFKISNQRIRIERDVDVTVRLKVRPRRGTDIEIVEAPDGRLVAIYGTATTAHPLTPTHNVTMDRLARQFARGEQYEYITRDRSLSTALDGLVESDLRPDLIGVRRDGRVNLFEVRSESQTRQQLEQKLGHLMSLLPPEMRGRSQVYEPDSL